MKSCILQRWTGVCRNISPNKCQTLVSQPRKKISVHHVAQLLESCASGGGGNAEEAEREPICQPHEPWQSQSQRRSNGTATYSGEVDQFLPVWPPLIETRSPSSLVKLQEQTHEYLWIKKTRKRFRCWVQVGDSPLAANLWWFWSFSPSQLWEIWSKGEKYKRKSYWCVIMTPIQCWEQTHLILWIVANNLKAVPELLSSTSEGHTHRSYTAFGPNLLGTN